MPWYVQITKLLSTCQATVIESIESLVHQVKQAIVLSVGVTSIISSDLTVTFWTIGGVTYQSKCKNFDSAVIHGEV